MSSDLGLVHIEISNVLNKIQDKLPNMSMQNQRQIQTFYEEVDKLFKKLNISGINPINVSSLLIKSQRSDYLNETNESESCIDGQDQGPQSDDSSCSDNNSSSSDNDSSSSNVSIDDTQDEDYILFDE